MTPVPPLDGPTIARVQAGDREAFDVLYSRYERPIYVYLARLLSGQQDAEELAADLTQETFLRAFLKVEKATFTEPRDIQGWLYRIATNKALDELRHRQVIRWLSFEGLFRLLHGGVRPPLDGRGVEDRVTLRGARPADVPVVLEQVTDPDTATNPEALVRAQEDVLLVKATLAALLHDERTALLLREEGGMDYDQIAATMGRSRASVKSLLWRARERLRAHGRRVLALQAATEAA